MINIMHIVKWILAISLLIVLIFFTNNRHADQLVKLGKIEIEMSDQNFINQQDILDYLKSKSVSFNGVLMHDFSKNKLENLLLAHPAIKDAQVFSSQSGIIDIVIKLKTAIIRIKTARDDYYLDEYGKKMSFSSNFIPKLLIASGDITSKDYNGIYKFIQEVNRKEFWKSQITQLYFEYDDVFLIPRIGAQRINIGSFENIKEKLDNLYHFYTTIAPKKGWGKYSDINLKFDNQIICTKN